MDLQSYEELKEITVFSHWVEWESAGIDLAERALACVGLSIKYESVYRQHWVIWELFIPAQFIWSLNLLLSFSIFRVLNKRNRLQVDFEESQ